MIHKSATMADREDWTTLDGITVRDNGSRAELVVLWNGAKTTVDDIRGVACRVRASEAPETLAHSIYMRLPDGLIRVNLRRAISQDQGMSRVALTVTNYNSDGIGVFAEARYNLTDMTAAMQAQLDDDLDIGPNGIGQVIERADGFWATIPG